MGEDWIRHFDELMQCWFYVNPETNERLRIEPEEEEAEQPTEDSEVLVDEYRKVEIIREVGGGPVFKHWALFVQDRAGDDGEYDGFICHIEGRRTQYRYVCKAKVSTGSPAFVDKWQVGYVDTNSLTALKEFAEAKVVHNEDEHWGCQDFAWELMKELEEVGLLEYCSEFEEVIKRLWELKGAGH